jgi:hypothetical protein
MKQIRYLDRRRLPLNVLRAVGSPSAGLVVGAAMGVYLAWVSVWTSSAAALLGTTPSGVYRHPILLALGGLLCGSMVIVTLRRIPFQPTTLGAWASHAGAVVLVLGGGWYGATHVRGDALFLRGPEGFSPVRHAYLDNTASVYVGLLEDDMLRQTPIRWPTPLEGSRDVDVPLAGAPGGSRLRLVRLLPAVTLVRTWTDDAPVAIPAARVTVADDDHLTRGVLCNAYEHTAVLAGAGWTMTFDGDANAAELAARSRPGPLAAPHDRITLMCGPALEPTLLIRRSDRSASHVALDANGSAVVHAAGRQLRITLRERLSRAQPTLRIDPDAPAPRQRAAAVELTTGNHTQRRILPFMPYPLDERPQRAWLPDGRSLDLHLGRAAVGLGATVTITRAEYRTQPGSVIPSEYLCELLIDDAGHRRRETLRLNRPVQLGPYQLNQGSWSPTPHEPTAIRLAVTTRPGLTVVWIGLALLLAGVSWAAFVKPILLRRARR